MSSQMYDTLSSDEAAMPQRLCVGVCSYIYIFIKKKKKFYSLLSLDRIHRSNIIAGNVTSSTCSERTSLPPVSLTGERRTEGDGRMEAGWNKEKNINTLCRKAQINTVVGDQIYWLCGEHIKTNKHLNLLFVSVWVPTVNHLFKV